MSRAALRPGCVALVWATALFGLGLVQPLDAFAEVRAAGGRKGLSTRVNGKRDGRCNSGVCRISEGSKSGRHRFYRLSRLNTRGKIRSIRFDSATLMSYFQAHTLLRCAWAQHLIVYSLYYDS